MREYSIIDITDRKDPQLQPGYTLSSTAAEAARAFLVTKGLSGVVTAHGSRDAAHIDTGDRKFGVMWRHEGKEGADGMRHIAASPGGAAAKGGVK